MQCTVLPHITASVFINDDVGLWAGPAQAPVAQPQERGRLSWMKGQVADAHLKRQVIGREVLVAVTNGRLDFGTWERIFSGQAEWLARES